MTSTSRVRGPHRMVRSRRRAASTARPAPAAAVARRRSTRTTALRYGSCSGPPTGSVSYTGDTARRPNARSRSTAACRCAEPVAEVGAERQHARPIARRGHGHVAERQRDRRARLVHGDRRGGDRRVGEADVQQPLDEAFQQRHGRPGHHVGQPGGEPRRSRRSPSGRHPRRRGGCRPAAPRR